ncbi:MAG: DUF131 domain-containing protein [Candidatus Thorarchaeota archaeon]|nr:DUF131 domain-containing protein [Candidatus Thorarchaeota archaeon]
MQLIEIVNALGWLLLISGILLVLFSILNMSQSKETSQIKSESKGVIFLGPIPIVWGYGKKGWMIAGIIGVGLMMIWLLLYF